MLPGISSSSVIPTEPVVQHKSLQEENPEEVRRLKETVNELNSKLTAFESTLGQLVGRDDLKSNQITVLKEEVNILSKEVSVLTSEGQQRAREVKSLKEQVKTLWLAVFGLGGFTVTQNFTKLYGYVAACAKPQISQAASSFVVQQASPVMPIILGEVTKASNSMNPIVGIASLITSSVNK